MVASSYDLQRFVPYINHQMSAVSWIYLLMYLLQFFCPFALCWPTPTLTIRSSLRLPTSTRPTVSGMRPRPENGLGNMLSRCGDAWAGCTVVKIKSLCFLFSEMGWTNKAESESIAFVTKTTITKSNQFGCCGGKGWQTVFGLGTWRVGNFFHFTIQPYLDLSLTVSLMISSLVFFYPLVG